MDTKESAANALWHSIESDPKRLDYVYYLKSRWQDEKEYEDFADYVEQFKKRFAIDGFEVTSLSKSFKAVFVHKATGAKFEVTFGRQVKMITK